MSVDKIRQYILDKRIMKKVDLDKVKQVRTLCFIVKKKRIKSAIIIQRNFRQYLYKLTFEDRMSQIKDMNRIYINTETLLGDNIENIDPLFFYTTNNFAFDIREIYKNDFINPYTNLPFNDQVEKQLLRLIKNYKYNNISLEITNIVPSEFELSVMMSNFFSKMTQYNTYPNIDVFIEYNTYELYIYMHYIFKFHMIKECLHYDEINRLHDFYNNHQHDITNDIANNEFNYYAIYLLNKIINLQQHPNIQTIALIISEAMMTDIVQAYSDKEYEHVVSYLLPEQLQTDEVNDGEEVDNNEISDTSSEGDEPFTYQTVNELLDTIGVPSSPILSLPLMDNEMDSEMDNEMDNEMDSEMDSEMD